MDLELDLGGGEDGLRNGEFFSQLELYNARSCVYPCSAAERYNDVGPDERARRKARGWGLNDSVCYQIIHILTGNSEVL